MDIQVTIWINQYPQSQAALWCWDHSRSFPPPMRAPWNTAFPRHPAAGEGPTPTWRHQMRTARGCLWKVKSGDLPDPLTWITGFFLTHTHPAEYSIMFNVFPAFNTVQISGPHSHFVTFTNTSVIS